MSAKAIPHYLKLHALHSLKYLVIFIFCFLDVAVLLGGDCDDGDIIQQDIPFNSRRKNQPVEKPTKKRQRNEDKWLVNIRKKKRLAGEEYVNKKGQIMPAKVMGPGCADSCRFKCHERVTIEQRKEVFKKYYEKVTTREASWAYMVMHVTKSPKAECTVGHYDSRKNFSFSYSFRCGGTSIKVCKTMFLSTLSITNSVVETAFKKLGEGGTLPIKLGNTTIGQMQSKKKLKRVFESTFGPFQEWMHIMSAKTPSVNTLRMDGKALPRYTGNTFYGCQQNLVFLMLQKLLKVRL